MKVFLSLCLLVLSLFAEEAKYSAFVQEQFSYLDQLDENNISNEAFDSILNEQALSYQRALENVLSDIPKYKQNSFDIKGRLYKLQKRMQINQKRGYTYALMRDKVQTASYRLLLAQRGMVHDVLDALQSDDLNAFRMKENEAIVKNQESISALNIDQYLKILDINTSSSTLEQAKMNVKELFRLNEINTDTIKYIAMYEDEMFPLGKYSKFGLIKLSLFLKHNEFAKSLNAPLKTLNLSLIKLLIFVILFFVLMILRKIFLKALDYLVFRLLKHENFVQDVLKGTTRTVGLLVITFFTQLVLFIYNDFNSIELVDTLYKITYTLLFTYLIYALANSIVTINLTKINRSKLSVKNEVVNLSIKVINFVIWTIGLLVVLHFAGANLTAILSGLGIGGFAVAFAAKETLSNFIGTVAILFSDIFSQGDWIEVDGKEGVIVEIGLRVTTLRTFDNSLISIPNATIASSDVRNWSRRKLGRRIKMSLGVRYDSKHEDIQNALKQIKEMLATHKGIASEKTEFTYSESRYSKLVAQEDEAGIKKLLMVYLDEFSDSSINILVYCFAKTVVWSEWLEVKEDIMFKIMSIFEANNLEFAYPSLSLYTEESEA